MRWSAQLPGRGAALQQTSTAVRWLLHELVANQDLLQLGALDQHLITNPPSRRTSKRRCKGQRLTTGTAAALAVHHVQEVDRIALPVTHPPPTDHNSFCAGFHHECQVEGVNTWTESNGETVYLKSWCFHAGPDENQAEGKPSENTETMTMKFPPSIYWQLAWTYSWKDTKNFEFIRQKHSDFEGFMRIQILFYFGW